LRPCLQYEQAKKSCVLYIDVIVAFELWCREMGRIEWYEKNSSRHEEELKRVFNDGCKVRQRQDRCGQGKKLHGYSGWRVKSVEASVSKPAEDRSLGSGMPIVDALTKVAAGTKARNQQAEPPWMPPSFKIA